MKTKMIIAVISVLVLIVLIGCNGTSLVKDQTMNQSDKEVTTCEDPPHQTEKTFDEVAFGQEIDFLSLPNVCVERKILNTRDEYCNHVDYEEIEEHRNCTCPNGYVKIIGRGYGIHCVPYFCSLIEGHSFFGDVGLPDFDACAVAIETENVEVCKTISSSSRIEKCLFSYAKITHNLQICKQINDLKLRKKCQE